MKITTVLLALWSLSLLAMAQEVPPKFFPYSYSIDDLPNRLRLVTVPTDNPNLVALYIVVQTGSRNEVEPGKSGYAHFFEHMMFRGSEHFTPEQRDQILKRAGASVNAYTSDDRTVYHTLFSKEDLDQVMELEADRFQRLRYSEDVYRTESRAILGEYNKNSASPLEKLQEKLRETAFDRHTYKHTTMGFLTDIEDMPNQYEYSLEFYRRYYRPEYTTIILAGDVTRERALILAKKYFGDWKLGNYTPEIPSELPQTSPRQAHINWPSPTLSYLVVAFHGPAYSDVTKDKAALDLLLPVAFGENSDLYQRLVLKEQKVDLLLPSFDDLVDPELISVYARVKDPKDLEDVRNQILATFERFTKETVSQEKLDQTRSRLRYGTALSWDSTEAVASYLAPYVALRRTPATVDKLFALYDRIIPDDVRKMAAKYFVENNRTIVTLASPSGGQASASQANEIATLLQPNQSPLISFRLLLKSGSIDDPKGKEGLAALTAAMLARGGSRELPYEKILEAMYPMATSFDSQVDKELTVFTGTTHRDNLDQYYGLIRQMLLEPGFREEDFNRLKSEAINYLKVTLRETNDEELGKEELYNVIYRDHAYGHHNIGTISSLEKLTLDDVRGFYQRFYRQGNLVLALAGQYPGEFPTRMRKDFAAWPAGATERGPALPEPKLEPGLRIEIVERETRSTAISLGFPIEVIRGDPDWPALAVVNSYFGQHRSSNSHLFQRLREARGLNYGDYSYIEYFPRGMFQFQPDPNLARRRQIFQIWIRPVEPKNGLFVLRAALYEYDRLLRDGLSKEDFESTREFLSKHINALLQTQDARLGYALDSQFYNIGEFGEYLRDALSKLTVEDVNRSLQRRLKSESMRVVIVTKDAQGLREAILRNKPSPITYNSPKPKEILDEDKLIAALPIPVKPDAVTMRPVAEVFE